MRAEEGSPGAPGRVVTSIKPSSLKTRRTDSEIITKKKKKKKER